MACRTLITVGVASVLAVAGALGLPAAFARPGAPSSSDVVAKAPAHVRLLACSRGPAPADRQALFRGSMRSLPGTRRMWMRFALQERVGDGRFRTVRAPGLGVWRKSLPGLRTFAYRQRVLALAEGAAYRAVVRFRWYGSDGELIRRARARSRPCREPGLLPNLVAVHVAGGQSLFGVPGAATYRVRVANRGRLTAPRFLVSLAVDGGTVDSQSVPSLAPDEVRELSFVAPACGTSVTARADPEDAVREASERDNVLTSVCPLRR